MPDQTTLDAYRITRISHDRLKDLPVLFASAFNLKVSLSYLEKKFDTERFGASFVGYIAYTEKGAPAAYYGVFPVRFKLNNRVLLAAQSGDTMTHKNHQCKGLFTKLAKMTYDLARKEGIEFIFGFPNNNSLPGFIKKLNWKIDGKRHFYNKRIYTFPLALLMEKLRLKDVYKVYFRFCGRLFGLKGCPEAQLIDRNNSIYYDSDGITYKNSTDKCFLQKKGCLVWIKVGRTLGIGCLHGTDDHVAAQMIRRLSWLAALAGLYGIWFWCSSNHPNIKVVNTRLKEQPNSMFRFYGHLDLTGNLPNHPDFLYEECDADTF